LISITILANFELSANSAQPSLGMKVSNHGSGKGLEKQSSIPGLQKLRYIDDIHIFSEFWNTIEFSQMAKNFEIQCYLVWYIVVGPMPGPFYLGGLLWHHCCMLQWHRNIFHFRNFVFVTLQLKTAPDNAAADPLELE